MNPAFIFGGITLTAVSAEAMRAPILPFINLGLVVILGIAMVVVLSRKPGVGVPIAVLDNLTHALVVVTTVLATCLLALTGHTSDTTVATVLGAAIGYAAGKGGGRAPARETDG